MNMCAPVGRAPGPVWEFSIQPINTLVHASTPGTFSYGHEDESNSQSKTAVEQKFGAIKETQMRRQRRRESGEASLVTLEMQREGVWSIIRGQCIVCEEGTACARNRV